MYKLWQKNLELKFSNSVIDIVQYGSSIIEGSKPNDIDICVFYIPNIKLEKQLEESQKIKVQIKKIIDLPIDIKSFTLNGFFESSNFAKESILLYGVSLVTKNQFVDSLGLKSRIQIKYNLSKLEKKDKIRLNYYFSGKKKNGFLDKIGGKIISPGLIEILPEYENIILDKIKEFTKDFEIKKILVLK